MVSLRRFCGMAALIAVAAAAGPVSASGGCFAKGDKIVDAGVGVWPFVIGGHFEVGVHDFVSVGGGTGIGFPGPVFPILARGAFHPFNLPVLQDKITFRDKLDAYIGVVAGLSISLRDIDATVEPSFGEIIGARFYMSEKIGFFAEHCGAWPGYDLGYIAGGVTFKF
jgi:hypothetical protein